MEGMTRAHGMVLFGLGIGVFAGTTNQLLPAVAFWPALVLSCAGAFVFMKANRAAMEEAEEHARKAVAPKIRNETMERFADRQAKTDGQALASMGEREVRGVAAQASRATQVNEDELVLYEVDDAAAPKTKADEAEFVVTNDVSFPLEIQEQGALADQLEKLKKLQQDGIISADEFATAKAKLLS
jgi:microsomal dipeptidase-like Zn-dependent dipeptidase